MNRSTRNSTADGDYDPSCVLPQLNDEAKSCGGPHTQFVCRAFSAEHNGNLTDVLLVVTCTKVYTCSPSLAVLRMCLLRKLSTVYQRTTEHNSEEVLLVFEGEHDLLLRGNLTCSGIPAKRLLPVLRALSAAHHPGQPLLLHGDYAAPLHQIAQLKPPALYRTPLVEDDSEGAFAGCPCWREEDALFIPQEEFRERVRNFFTVYAPDRLPTVEDICRKHRKRYGTVLKQLTIQMGPEPTHQEAQEAMERVLKDEQFNSLFSQQSPQPFRGKDVTLLLGDNANPKRNDLFGKPSFSSYLLASASGAEKITLTIEPVATKDM